MEYVVLKKQTVNGETTKYNSTQETLEAARKVFHNQLAASYATEGLEHVMAIVVNDVCGVECQEFYYAPTEETTEETTE